MHIIQMIFALVAWHFVADYPLQGDTVAKGKNRSMDPALFGVPWYYWLSGHAATHAVFVGALTGSVWAGAFEFAAHFAIDHGKCSRLYGIHVDQVLHVACKIGIAVFVSVLS